MSSLTARFKEFIDTHTLFTKNDRLLVAVSGGVDSVVLCELLFQLGYHFVIAHCNFQLRGEESNQDELFVKKLAEKYHCAYKTVSFDTQQIAIDQQQRNIQQTARKLRYEWFNQLMATSENEEQRMACVLTAHHAGDNAETVLNNYLKGTGIRGLMGMEIKDGGIGGRVVRPLLFASKKEIQEFAATYALSWREDSSNESVKYQRNYLRHIIMPSIQAVIPEAEENILNNIQRFREISHFYVASIAAWQKKYLKTAGKEIHIPILALKKTPGYTSVLFETVQSYGFTAHQLQDIVSLLEAESGKYVASETHRIIRNRKWLIIATLQTEEARHILIERDHKTVHFEQGKITLQEMAKPPKISTAAKSVQLDLGCIPYPIILRKWKTGDYFYPLGLGKKKKLSRFFIDFKLSATDKEKVWVMETGNRIMWVVGQRIDDRFKITAKTQQVLELTFSE